jgi:hypothetical protein
MLSVSAGKNESMYAVCKLPFIKINEQSDRNIDQLEITHQLRFMDRKHLRDRFRFNQNVISVQQQCMANPPGRELAQLLRCLCSLLFKVLLEARVDIGHDRIAGTTLGNTRTNFSIPSVASC